MLGRFDDFHGWYDENFGENEYKNFLKGILLRFELCYGNDEHCVENGVERLSFVFFGLVAFVRFSGIFEVRFIGHSIWSDLIEEVEWVLNRGGTFFEYMDECKWQSAILDEKSAKCLPMLVKCEFSNPRLVFLSFVNERRTKLVLRGFVGCRKWQDYCGCRGRSDRYGCCWCIDFFVPFAMPYDISTDLKLPKYQRSGVSVPMGQELLLWCIRAGCIDKDVAGELNGFCRAYW